MKVAARKLFRGTMLPAYQNGGIVSGMDMPPPMDMPPRMNMPPPMDTGAMDMPPPPEMQIGIDILQNAESIDNQLDQAGDNPEGVIQALTGKSIPEARDELAGIVGLPYTHLSLIHISEPTRRTPISYAVFCLKK